MDVLSVRRRQDQSLDTAPDADRPRGSATRRDVAPVVAFGLHESLLAEFVRHATGPSSLDAMRIADRAVQARMDAFLASTAGPYRVDGEIVVARPQFRMSTGLSEQVGLARKNAEVFAACKDRILHHELTSVGVSRALVGRGTPNDVCRATQALIDAGKLVTIEEMRAMHAKGQLDGPLDHPSTADRIRATQWTYGLGFDCAGYSQHALLAAHGLSADPRGRAALHLKAEPGNESFGDARGRLESIEPELARAGDIISLKGQTNEVGHVVIVYSHERGARATNEAIARFAKIDAAAGRAAERFASGRDVDVYEVDSSWGADLGGTYGGVRRDTWLFDREGGSWAWLNPHGGANALEVGSAPAAEAGLLGVYRAKH